MDPIYAVSPHRSGIYWFDNDDDAQIWCEEWDGATIAPERVDPDIRHDGRVWLAKRAPFYLA